MGITFMDLWLQDLVTEIISTYSMISHTTYLGFFMPPRKDS